MKIVADKLGKRFNREWVFRNFSYEFDSGNFYAITGPNGSGKSTLMQVLWGQMQPSAGTLAYSSVEPSEIYTTISIAAPYLDLIEEFTLQEMVEFHFKFKKPRLPLGRLFEISGLQPAMHKQVSTFSSGMRQRLKLLLAFYAEAEALFLDEPTTNLDQNSIGWYKEHLALIPKETIVLIASNQEHEYPASAHKVDILHYK
ncbi:MAG: ATP-binding cassette domain-containing protein [Bacteroidetes bacterium]|nr:ATP-binding cassette domain-containing protein [Bacteroidota bacterium]